MNGAVQSTKPAKMLRIRAQEFLASRRNSNQLIELMNHLNSGSDTLACLQALEHVFTVLLSENQMYQEVVPLKVPPRTVDVQYMEWLRSMYNEFWLKILQCFEHGSSKVEMQALTTAMKLIEVEGRHPLESRGELTQYIPLNRLRATLARLLLRLDPSTALIDKFHEWVVYDDLLFYTWKSLPPITAKLNISLQYVMNYLLLLEKLPVCSNQERALLCCDEQFVYEEHIAVKCLNKIWNFVMQWEQNAATHKQTLIVLLERVFPHLEKPQMLTDFLMDSLDVGGTISLLALQGIFTMIRVHNLDYPNIFVKLYSMFEPEIFHTKFKARLFYLSDMFLSSTHLPENMVAAFAKRLARLALVAPSEDAMIICMFIGNLIIRHPGLKCMLNHPQGGVASEDPYIMEERDPVKSNAINSSLWEIRTLQNHSLPSVAVAARFINVPLPSVEWNITKYLDRTTDDIFDKNLMKNHKLIAMAFDQHAEICLGHDLTSQFWNF